MRKETWIGFLILILLIAAGVWWSRLENPKSLPAKEQLEEFAGYYPLFENGQAKKGLPGDTFALVSNVFYLTEPGPGAPVNTRDGRDKDFEALRLGESKKLQRLLGDLLGESFFSEHVIMLPVEWHGDWVCIQAEGCYPEGRIAAVGPLSQSKAKRLCDELARRDRLCFVMSF